MNWSSTAFERACRDYESRWSATDEVLYRLCREHPDHRSPNSVNAKLWIIGRAYATGIERKITTDGTQGSSLTQLSKHLVSHAREIDGMIGRLAEVAEPLTVARLSVAVAEHGRFVGLLKPILRRKQAPRSFASKYLHFHCPAVPIYDSVASAALRKLVRWSRPLVVCDPPPEADMQYFWFVMRFWTLYEQARSRRSSARVKLLDHYLTSASK